MDWKREKRNKSQIKGSKNPWLQWRRSKIAWWSTQFKLACLWREICWRGSSMTDRWFDPLFLFYFLWQAANIGLRQVMESMERLWTYMCVFNVVCHWRPDGGGQPGLKAKIAGGPQPRRPRQAQPPPLFFAGETECSAAYKSHRHSYLLLAWSTDLLIFKLRRITK